MDRKKQIAALTDDEGERLLLAQACERLTRAEQRGIPAATVFLTPREQALLRQLLPQCRFWGGTPDAERAVAYWLPEYEDEDDYRENGPVACLRAAFFEENAVGHRDMLGALMGCGIRREAVGDLCLQPRQCDLFVTAELAPYLLDNLTSAGRAHLTLTRIALSQADRPPQALQELRVTVSSPRLDSVISAAFHLSRGSAADAVAAGRVNLNDLPCLKPDRAVQENDTVSVRELRQAARARPRRADKEGPPRPDARQISIKKHSAAMLPSANFR
ncbi:MAG: RNA-binding protein [Oscillospiraceae bacterium]